MKTDEIRTNSAEDTFHFLENNNNAKAISLLQETPYLDLNNIPEELCALKQWVVHKNKIPYDAKTGMAASTTDANTWSSYDEAVKAVIEKEFDGIGFVFSKVDLFAGIDLDDCIADGIVLDWAQDIITLMNSYTEISPSGKGIHIIVKGTVPSGRNRTQGVEMYSSGRYFTVTGKHLEKTPLTIESRQDELNILHKKLFPTLATEVINRTIDYTKSITSESIVLNKLRTAKNADKFNRLFSGNTSDYPSHSEADLALCSMIAFYTDDKAIINNIFKKSGLYREKWDEKHGDETYGQITIRKALSNTADNISPLTTDISIRETDLGNAKRLVSFFGKNIRFIKQFNKWYLWNNKCWLPDDTGVIVQLAKQTVELIFKEAAQETDESKRTALTKHAIHSQNATRINAMIKLAESEPEIAVKPDIFDANPWLLNVNNGTIDLKTGILREHRREDYISKILPIEFDRTASCPMFLNFLNEIMAGKADVISYIQKLIGYSLTGSTRERIISILWGTGKNGKSTLLEVVLNILNSYAKKLPAQTLMDKKNTQIPNDIAALKGVRFVSATETEEGQRMAESLIKELSGNDTISARFLYGEWFSFKPEFKIWLATNHKPIIRGTDNGIWDRIRLIPFTVRISEEKQDPELIEKLLREAPGILNWMVQGCLEWQKEGLQTPQAVFEAGSEYRNEMDTLSNFLNDCCIAMPSAKTPVAELYQKYELWCQKNKEITISRKRFSMQLLEHGFERIKIDGNIHYKGIVLKPEP